MTRSSLAQWILESMSSGVVAIDAAGHVQLWNAAAQRVLGCTEEEAGDALGRPCREVLAGHPTLARLLLEARERKTPLSRAELPLSGPGAGPPRTLGFTLCPVSDPEGAPRGAVMLFRDLTPIERRDERRRLGERLAALGQMAAGMAHEIRNPLAGMEVIAGLLRRRLADREAERELVDELLGELRRVAATVSSALDFVRPVAPSLARVDPVRLLDEALDEARARVPFAGRVERVWDAELPALDADADELRSALASVVENALEALAEGGGGRLALSVRGSGGDVVFGIADDGPGVPPELREKIFYPFFTTRERGSGLGLAAAQRIVASHGGSLELEGAPGPGARFRVRLPGGGEAR